MLNCLDPHSPRLADVLRNMRLRKGWNMDRVAAAAGISRTTLYHLERGAIAHPRAATLYKLARALGVPIERLQPGVSNRGPEEARLFPKSRASDPKVETACSQLTDGVAGREFDRTTNPEVQTVAAAEPSLFDGWTEHDWDQLYSTFAVGGALTEEGVRAEAAKINRNRETIHRLHIVLETHLSEVAAGMIDTLYRMVRVQPRHLPPNEPEA